MKKVINGKLYDTDTAKRLGSWDNEENYGDFGYTFEALYKTEAGAYFISYKGGAASKYARRFGNGRRGSEGVTLLTEADACRWCEEHDIEVDVIQKHFQISDG